MRGTGPVWMTPRIPRAAARAAGATTKPAQVPAHNRITSAKSEVEREHPAMVLVIACEIMPRSQKVAALPQETSPQAGLEAPQCPGGQKKFV